MSHDSDQFSGFIDWLARAHLWRKRAEQIQLIAEGMSDASARSALARQARQWAAMAEEAEHLARRWQEEAADALQKH